MLCRPVAVHSSPHAPPIARPRTPTPLKRCSSLTKGETLLQLTQAFTRVLCKYAQKLLARLPSTASASSPLATGLNTTDWHVKMDGDEERVACLIINTAEYCYETVEGLAESCVKLTDEPFKERIDMTVVEDEFSSVTTTALSKLWGWSLEGPGAPTGGFTVSLDKSCRVWGLAAPDPAHPGCVTQCGNWVSPSSPDRL